MKTTEERIEEIKSPPIPKFIGICDGPDIADYFARGKLNEVIRVVNKLSSKLEQLQEKI
jgi:hypothetical protein